MQEPNISWYAINKNGEEISTDEFYAGSYRYDEYLQLDIRLWNNRWGEEDIESARDIVFEIEFLNLEDSIMLEDISIKENGIDVESFIESNKIKARLRSQLSGKKHSIIDEENEDNYTDVNISIYIRNGLTRSIKQMILGLDYSRGDI